MQLSTQAKYTLAGIAFGLTFPGIAWVLDILYSDLTFSPAVIVQIHRDNILHFVIDVAPFVLGVVFYFLGGAYQTTLNRGYISRFLAKDELTGSRIGSSWAISIVAVCTLLFFGASSWYIQQEMRLKAQAEMGVSLDTILATTEQAAYFWLKEEQSHILTWARTEGIVQATHALLSDQNSRQDLIASRFQTELRTWIKSISEIRGYQGFFIISPEGINLASSRDSNTGEVNMVLQHHPDFLEKIWQGNTALSSPHHAHVALPDSEGKLQEGLITMFVGAPIKTESGEIIAALTFRLNPQADLSPILERGRIGISGETYAFIKEGEIISQSRFESQIKEYGITYADTANISHLEVRDPGVNLILGERTDVSRHKQPFTLMAISAMAGESGRNLEGYRDYRGVPVVGSWLWSDRLGFGMTTEIDVAEAYAVFDFNRRIILISALILGILTLGFAAILNGYLNASRRTSQMLRENEQSARLLLNSTGEAIYGINVDGDCTFANQTCLDMLGNQYEAELLGKNMHELVHHTRNDGSLYPVEECKIYLAIQQGEGTHVDDEVLWRADGNSFASEYRSFPIRRRGEVIGAVVSFTDISARIEAREIEQQRLDTLVRFRDAIAEIVKLTEALEATSSINSIQKRILKIIAVALDVERASTWFYDEDHSNIIADNLYRKTEDAYESGQVLSAERYPDYFKALAESTVIAADDAAVDPRTREFKVSYLIPLGITSMMDVPIKIQGKTVGVICLEHIGEMRQWDLNEHEFATSVSISLALAMESDARLKSEARQLAVVNTMVDGLITMNEDGLVDSFNPAAENIFGYTSAEIIGKNINQLMPEPNRSQHHKYLQRYKTTGEAHILGITGIEVEGLHKNGRVFPISITISEMVIDGQRRFSGVMRDITERKQLQAERDLVTAELSLLIDTANALIFGIDTDGKLNEWNRHIANVTGFSKVEVIGRHAIKDLVTEKYKQPVRELLDSALKGKEFSSLEFALNKKDGGRIEVLLNVATRRDMDGNVTGIIIVGQDITELRERENELNQAQKMEAVGQLTGGIAHDFNNLLSVISGNLRFLQQDIGETSAEINELFEDATSAVDDGVELIGRLLTFSRTTPLRSATKNVNDAIDQFARFLSRTLGENIELDVDLPEEILFISVDSSQLENALLNLTLNARDAMPGGGTITIGITKCHYDDGSPPGDYIVISVTDVGSGISVEDLQHVYEPFFTTKAVGRGSGLGLSMVYSFTRQSNGHCEISSTLGQGTTVSMYFPAVGASRDIDIESKGDKYLAGNSEVILVVEDEPRVRKVVLRDLENLGYRTLEAENAAVARRIIESGDPVDLLFTDVLMPGEMNGRMLGVWTADNYPEIKVILTSGYSKGDTETSSDKADVFPIVRKPYSIDILAEQIRTLLLK